MRPHELQHARPLCPSPSPRVHSNSWSNGQTVRKIPNHRDLHSFPTRRSSDLAPAVALPRGSLSLRGCAGKAKAASMGELSEPLPPCAQALRHRPVSTQAPPQPPLGPEQQQHPGVLGPPAEDGGPPGAEHMPGRPGAPWGLGRACRPSPSRGDTLGEAPALLPTVRCPSGLNLATVHGQRKRQSGI